MEFAQSESNERIVAIKGARGFCSICGKRLIPRCGPKNINHWAHFRNKDCDPWREGETEWHRNWKNKVLPENREIVIRKGEEIHRADVQLPDSQIIVEFQKSRIDFESWSVREKFYQKMMWVLYFNRENVMMESNCEMYFNMFGDTILTLKNFHWAYTISSNPHPVFLDFNDGDMFWITEFYNFGQIYGQYIRKIEFINRYLQNSRFYDIESLRSSNRHARHKQNREREWKLRSLKEQMTEEGG